jgi:hypothetical protein
MFPRHPIEEPIEMTFLNFRRNARRLRPVSRQTSHRIQSWIAAPDMMILLYRCRDSFAKKILCRNVAISDKYSMSPHDEIRQERRLRALQIIRPIPVQHTTVVIDLKNHVLHNSADGFDLSGFQKPVAAKIRIPIVEFIEPVPRHGICQTAQTIRACRLHCQSENARFIPILAQILRDFAWSW